MKKGRAYPPDLRPLKGCGWLFRLKCLGLLHKEEPLFQRLKRRLSFAIVIKKVLLVRFHTLILQASGPLFFLQALPVTCPAFFLLS